jgi:hypothetical protein
MEIDQEQTYKYIMKHCLNYVRLEVFTAVTMKNGVFWNVKTRGSRKLHAACVGC